MAMETQKFLTQYEILPLIWYNAQKEVTPIDVG